MIFLEEEPWVKFGNIRLPGIYLVVNALPQVTDERRVGVPTVLLITEQKLN